MKLLHVEDNDGCADLVRIVFGVQRGWKIVRVKSIRDAIEKLERNGYMCILLDFELPDAKGLEGLRKLREHFGRIPIVGHSGDFDPALMPEARKLGLYDVIHKDSFFPPVIERAIRLAIVEGQYAKAEEKVAKNEESQSRIMDGLKEIRQRRTEELGDTPGEAPKA